MEKHSIDNIVKNHLKDRGIEPTNNAWDRLDSMLTIAEEKPKNKIYILRFSLLAAASLVGIILVMINIVFNDQQGVLNQNKNLAISENILPANAQELEIVNPNEDFEDSKPKFVAVENKINKPNSTLKSFNSQVVKKAKNEYLELSSIETENKNIEIAANISKEEKVMNAQFVSEKVNETYKSRINADKLLANIESPNTIQKHTSLSQVQIEISSKIDPNKLLRAAENEVNERFMHKIFKNIQETTAQVLTSVSQRNIEK